MAAGVGLGVLLSRPSAAPASHVTSTSGAVITPPPPPPTGPPPSAYPELPGGRAAVGMLQPYGDGSTGFLVHGINWPPGRPLSVLLVGYGVASVHPVPDRAGSFNFIIDQGHLFFAGAIPPGSYRVIVTGPGGRQAYAHFVVNPLLQPGQRPGSPPPPGGTGTSPGGTGTSPDVGRPLTSGHPARLGPRRPGPHGQGS